MTILGNLPVGTTVWMEVSLYDASLQRRRWQKDSFLILQHGRPDTEAYGTDYLGGTILMYTGLSSGKLGTDFCGAGNEISDALDAAYYPQTTLASEHLVNNRSLSPEVNFSAMLTAEEAACVMPVRIPYCSAKGFSPVINKGNDGYLASYWLPSAAEVCSSILVSDGISYHYQQLPIQEGSRFAYFRENGNLSEMMGGSRGCQGFFTRTPATNGINQNRYTVCNASGLADDFGLTGESTTAQRPCFVMPDTVAVDEQNVVTMALSIPAKVGGVWRKSEARGKQAGVWRTVQQTAVKIGGVWKT